MKKEFVFSLKRPFENWKIATIGIIISSLIIGLSLIDKFSKNLYVLSINAAILIFLDLLLAGFNIENIHNVLKKKKLPKFDNIWRKVWYGIVQYVIAIIYQSPGLILLALGVYSIKSNPNSVYLAIIGITYILIVYFVQMASIIEYSKKFKFKDAFKSINFKKGYSKIFISYGIVGIISSIFFALILTLSIIGAFLIPWFVSIFQYTFLTIGYKKIKK